MKPLSLSLSISSFVLQNVAFTLDIKCCLKFLGINQVGCLTWFEISAIAMANPVRKKLIFSIRKKSFDFVELPNPPDWMACSLIFTEYFDKLAK